MDTEKAIQADASFKVQPSWVSCVTCRATQKKQYILKCIMGFVLLGLLALNTYQSIYASPIGLSSLQLEQHYTTSIETHEHHDLSLVVEVPPTTNDAPWAFTVYTKNGCSGNATNIKGDGPSVTCQPLNQAYNSTSVPQLDHTLKICFYEKEECGGNSTEIKTKNDCQNILTSNTYRVLTNETSCSVA